MGSDWRGKDLCGVVSLRDCSSEEIREKYFPKLEEFFVQNCCEMYCYILHDMDVVQDAIFQDGVLVQPAVMKTPHIHFVAEMNTKKRGTKMTCWIGKIARSLGVDVRAVSLEKAENVDGCIQYLTHRNCPDKYQYPVSDIHTSMTPESLEVIMTRDVKSFTFELLCSIVDSSSSLRELISRVGFKTYIGYRNVIQDLWKDKFAQPQYILEEKKDYAVGRVEETTLF